MIALLICLLSAIVGLGLILAFGQNTFLSWPEKAATSLVLGVVGPAALGSLFSLLLSGQQAIITAWLVWLTAGLGSWLKYYTKPLARKLAEKIEIKISFWSWIFIILMFCLLVLLLCTQLWPNGLELLIPARGFNDTIFHLAQIKYIASQPDWKFSSPYFAGEFINYPFFSDFFSAQLLKAGSGLWAAYQLPNFFLCFALLIYLAILANRDRPHNSWRAILTILAVLFASGLSYFNPNYFLLAPSKVTFPLQPISYQGLVLSFLLFQKSFILGVPLALAGFFTSVAYIEKGGRQQLFWAVILLGQLPFTHTHSFIAMALILAGMFIGLIFCQAAQAKRCLIIIAIFAVVTLPQVLAIISLPKFSLGSAPLLRWGWMSNPLEAGGIKLAPGSNNGFLPWLLLQFWNFGPLLLWPLLLFPAWKYKYKNPLALGLFCGGALLWLMANIVQFQVWDFDNNKFFVYAIAILILAAISLIKNFEPSVQKKFMACLILVIFLSLPIAGIKIYQTIAFGLKDRKAIFTQPQQQAAGWLEHNTPKTAVIISGIPQTPKDSAYLVGLISGRASYLSFNLWLYTHDTNFLPRQKLIADFLQNPENTTLQNAIPENYLVIGPELKQSSPQLESLIIKAGYQQVYGSQQINIYFLKKQKIF